MYVIKSVPEDFVVEEITKIKKNVSGAKLRWKEKMRALRGNKTPEKKRYTIFRMKKTNLNLFEAIELISEKTGIPKKDFGYAGTKDKKAVTIQTISVPEYPKSELLNLEIKGINILDVFKSDKPIKLGDLIGNRFHIIVRNIDENIKENIEKNLNKIKKNGFLNLFGKQRFGSDNAEIGKMIIKKDFKKAAELLVTSNKDVKYYLSENRADYIGSVKILPKMLSRMFIHAYQSQIWNETAEKIKRNCMIPIIGSKTKLENYPESKDIVEKIMKRENNQLSDFVIKDIMFLSTRGGERKSIIRPDNLSYSIGNDDMNKDKLKLILDFELPKGSYATVFVNYIMKYK